MIKKDMNEKFKEFSEDVKNNIDSVDMVIVSEKFVEEQFGEGAAHGSYIDFNFEKPNGEFIEVKALIVKDYRLLDKDKMTIY